MAIAETVCLIYFFHFVFVTKSHETISFKTCSQAHIFKLEGTLRTIWEGNNQMSEENNLQVKQKFCTYGVHLDV